MDAQAAFALEVPWQSEGSFTTRSDRERLAQCFSKARACGFGGSADP